MKPMNGQNSVEHPGELLLAYVEGTVSDDDRSRVEKHMSSCADCRSEVLELERTIGALKRNKDLFCPELWELLDFLQHKEDPEGKIADHLTRCPLCRQELEELKQGCEESAAPESIRNLFREQTKQVVQPETAEQGRSAIARLRELIASMLPRPMLAVASAAAVALLVIFLYPESEVRPIIGLSTIDWQQPDSSEVELTPKSLRLMGPSRSSAVAEHPRPRVAVLLILSGFEPPCPQETIDSLYRSLCPSREIIKRVELIPPSQVKEVLSPLSARPTDPGLLAGNLFEKLSLSGVLHLRITAGDRGHRIEGEMMNAATRESMGKDEKDVASDGDLPEALRDLAFALLKQAYLKGLLSSGHFLRVTAHSPTHLFTACVKIVRIDLKTYARYPEPRARDGSMTKSHERVEHEVSFSQTVQLDTHLCQLRGKRCGMGTVSLS